MASRHMCRRGVCLRAAACAHERQRLCVAAVRPRRCPEKFRPAARKRRRHSGGPCGSGRASERAVANIASGRCRGHPNGRAFPGPDSCRKIRKLTLRIHHFRGSLFSRKKEASARPARCPLSSRFGGTCLRCRSHSPLRLHPLPPEWRPGPLQSKHISTQRPCSSPWPWSVFIAEAESFADRCIEAFDAC